MNNKGGGQISHRQGESFKRLLLSAGIAAAIFIAPIPKIHAEEIHVVLPYIVDNHDRVRAAEARLTAARNRAREALGDWFPTLGQTVNAGHERQQNDAADDSSTGFNEYDISLTQLLWDFGSTNAAIDKARLQVEEARYSLIETKQSLILEAVTAYMDLVRARATLDFATESEANIRRQTGLEEALVSLGSGFSTDVLQAKTQLAGAQARRAQNEGALTNALNRYKAVFGRMPDDLAALGEVPYPAAYLPTTLTQSVDVALETNPALKNAILAADIAMEDVRIAKADSFFPRIEASGERKFKKNVGGTIGSEQETLAKIEMTMDFNLGLTAINTLKASESDLSASTFSAADTRRTIEEQVRNAWQQLETARRTASHLNNQANIAEAFLELARNERQLGRRSLIDVLSGETNLINSRSDALSAETDVIIAAYGLLAATGQLEYDIIKRSQGIKAPVFQEEPQPSAKLQNNGNAVSLISEDNRTSKELMAMLRKTVKAMPVIAETPTRPDTATESQKISDIPPAPAAVKPVVTIEPKTIDPLWDKGPEQTSNYNDVNNLIDRDSQVASTDVSTAYDPTEFDYVPADGDLSVDSTPDEVIDVASIQSVEETQTTSYVADMPASPEEIAALTQDIDNLSDNDMAPSPERKIGSQPKDEKPSIRDALTQLFSFFSSASNKSAVEFETHDVAALDWSTPLPAKTSTQTTESKAPTPNVVEQPAEAPDFFKTILSFFEGLSAKSAATKSEEISERNYDEASEEVFASTPSTADTENLTSAIDLPATPETTEADKPGLIDFLTDLFSIETMTEKFEYSKLEEDPNEEFGR